MANNYISGSDLPVKGEIMLQIGDYYGLSDWQLNKVGYDAKTNSIRARFKHQQLGFISGQIVADFEFRASMGVLDIYNNMTQVRVNPTDHAIALATSLGHELHREDIQTRPTSSSFGSQQMFCEKCGEEQQVTAVGVPNDPTVNPADRETSYIFECGHGTTIIG